MKKAVWFKVQKLFCILAMLSMGSLGCAEPKYLTSSSSDQGAGALQKVADCTLQFSQSRLCMSWQWEVKPSSSQSGSLVFKVYYPNALDQTPVMTDLAQAPEVILWMPGMGHGSSPTSVESVDVGTYRAKNVFFIMPGLWEIKFQVKNGDRIEDEVVVEIHI